MQHPIVEQYEAGGARLMDLIQGLTRADLVAFPIPGTWSIQQIVLHLTDADQVIADRMKRVIAEENPTLLAFAHDAWTARLQYHEQSAEEAAQMFALCRRQMVRVLRALPESALERSGMHSQAGKKTLKDLIEGASRHLDHHLKFLFEKRAKLGKPK